MFGRIRTFSSSTDSLERPPSKILKDDSLSIYEATLVKLKLGSQRDLSSVPKEAAEEVETDSASSLSCPEAIKLEAYFTSASTLKGSHDTVSSPRPHGDLMTIDADCSSTTSISESSGDSQSSDSSKQHWQKDVSVLYLFSKFKTSQLSSSYAEAMTADDDYSASASARPSSCESFSSSEMES